MRIICRECFRDLEEIEQLNMSDSDKPLCEDCYKELYNYKTYRDDYFTEEDDRRIDESRERSLSDVC